MMLNYDYYRLTGWLKNSVLWKIQAEMTLNPRSELFYRRCRWLKGIRAGETQQSWLGLGVLKIPLVVYQPLGPTANLKVMQTLISFF